MKAIVYRDFGSPDVLHLEEVPIPVPADNQVLVRVRAAAANPLDWRLMRGGAFLFRLLLGLRKPKRPGVDVAGEVEAVGARVTRFRPGDAVFGCARGSFAEYALARENALALKPQDVSFEEAAAIPIAGLTALQGLRDRGRLQRGQRLLINGAAGGVGTFAVQIAKSFGAEVTGVCSTRNLDLVRSLGADRVIDYTREDFTRSPDRYDLIFDCVGNHSFAVARRILQPSGLKVGIAPPHGGLLRITAGMLQGWLLSLLGNRKFVFFMAKARDSDLTTLAELLASGAVRPVLDRTVKGLAAVPEAIRYLEQGHARGKVVISVAPSPEAESLQYASSESPQGAPFLSGTTQGFIESGRESF
jgi:NADPH:quinone reductase-like Zn-dependent oxidoreductase